MKIKALEKNEVSQNQEVSSFSQFAVKGTRNSKEKLRDLEKKSISPQPSLHYSPTGKNLIVRTSQKTDCFSARSLDELLAKAFEDFPKSS